MLAGLGRALQLHIARTVLGVVDVSCRTNQGVAVCDTINCAVPEKTPPRSRPFNSISEKPRPRPSRSFAMSGVWATRKPGQSSLSPAETAREAIMRVEHAPDTPREPSAAALGWGKRASMRGLQLLSACRKKCRKRRDKLVDG
jgi:hypothetical protein